jgi:hypothetical protein
MELKILKIAIFGVKIDRNGGVIGMGVHGLTYHFFRHIGFSVTQGWDGKAAVGDGDPVLGHQRTATRPIECSRNLLLRHTRDQH